MQMRRQGKKVVLIRSRYSAEKKRCVPLQVASFPSGALTTETDVADGGRSLFSDEAWAELTELERHQLGAWLTAERERLLAAGRRRAVALAPRLFQRLAEALAADEVDGGLADEITRGLADVRKAMGRRQRKARVDVTSKGAMTIRASGTVSVEDASGEVANQSSLA